MKAIMPVLAIFTIVGFASELFAQCTVPGSTDEVAEGEPNPDNECEICRSEVFESLPEPTRCGDSTGLECDDDGVFLYQCVAFGGAEDTECLLVKRGDDCPSGYSCNEDEGVCAQECSTALPCRDGYDCIDERCEPLPDPPDMGSGDAGASNGIDKLDTGPPPDMGPGAEDDAGSGGDGRGDTGRDDGAGMDPDGGGCCAVVGADRSTSGLVALLLAALIVVRRRTR